MTTTSDWPATNTQHGLLVAFGEFLKQHGLIESLMWVPIAQKTSRFAPQAKLVEFLVGILSGMEHLEDLTEAPHPLTKDAVVIQAWGQSGFAHYSSVSRTLEVCDDQTVRAVEQAISDFNRPFIDTQVNELLRRGMAIQYDLDLMGQAVSPTSTTYPEARFGWMDDRIQLGYPHLTVGQVSIGAGLCDGLRRTAYLAGGLSSSGRYRLGDLLEGVAPCRRGPDANPATPPDGFGPTTHSGPAPNPDAVAAVAGATDRQDQKMGSGSGETHWAVLPCGTAIEGIGLFCREKGSFAQDPARMAEASATAGRPDCTGSTDLGEASSRDGTRGTAVGGVENVAHPIGKR